MKSECTCGKSNWDSLSCPLHGLGNDKDEEEGVVDMATMNVFGEENTNSGSNKFPEHIMRQLRQRRNLDENDTSLDKEINSYTCNEAFEQVIIWEGLGSHYFIKGLVNDIYGIDLDKVEEARKAAASENSDEVVGEGWDSLPQEEKVKLMALLERMKSEDFIARRSKHFPGGK